MTSGYNKIYFNREFNSLSGTRNRNIIILSIMLFLTLTALAYAIGGIEKLKEKMENPFSNWIELPIPHDKQTDAYDLMSFFEEKEHRDSFNISSLSPHIIIYRELLSLSSKKANTVKIRSIHEQSKLRQEILIPSNIFSNKYYLDQKDYACGIIIKKACFDNLAIPVSPDYLYIPVIEEGATYRNVYYLPIIAIVQDLPDNADAIISNHLSKLFMDDWESSSFISIGSINKINMLFDGDRSELERIINDDFPLLDSLNVSIQAYDVEEYLFGTNTLLVKVYLDQPIPFNQRNSLTNEMVASDLRFKSYTEYACDVGEKLEIKKPYYLAFNFSKLDKVAALKTFLKNRFDFEIPMGKIKDKENYYTVGLLTFIISILLFSFGLISIILFVQNLLRSHLEKIKKNIGTLKAFGVDNQTTQRMYLRIIIFFISICTLIALIASLIFLIINNYVLKIEIPVLLLDYRILLAIIVLYISSLFTAIQVIKSTLQKSPGDLIYNR